MAINFPNNPSVNDTFTVGGTTFTFTGVKWETSAVVDLSSDTTPSLGGDLDGGAKNINNVGVITATTFSGNLTGNADTATSATSATTATTATNAQGLTGDPSIQVTNATVLGNLDVQGTTTTIDTAITEVDSLNVEGSVGIGTTNPGAKLEIHSNTIPRINSVYQGSKHFGMSVGGSGGGFVLTDGHFMTVNHQPYADRGTDNNLTERLRITSGGTLFSYSPDDTTPNFKFRSDDTNWHGALNQSVHGATITTFLSCGGDWDASGTTYNCTKNLAAYPSSAIAVHNQYNNSFESKFVFLKKAGGSTTTDGSVTELASISSAGTISDSIGPLRRLGVTVVASGGNLSVNDAGKLLRSTGNGSTLTIPQNVFSAGDMISIFNVSTGDNTIAEGTGATLYNTADGATGNRTLGPKGVCTILCTSTNEFIISGSQVS